MLGNCNGKAFDDFILPSGELVLIDSINLQKVHEEFAIHCEYFMKATSKYFNLLIDTFCTGMLGNDSKYNLGKSLFQRLQIDLTRQTNIIFTPDFDRKILHKYFNENSTTANKEYTICGENAECRFDLSMTLDEDIARSTMALYEQSQYFKRIFRE